MITGKACTEPALWDEVIHDLGGHPLQLWGWGELKSAHNWSARRVLFVDEGEVVVGAAQILVRHLPGPFRRLCYVPRGPVWSEGREVDILQALALYTKQHLPGTVLTVEPDTEKLASPQGWRQSQNTILIPRTLILDLDKTEDGLQEVMTKKTRQYIRKSSREELIIRQLHDPEEIRKCLLIYHETALRAGFSLHDDQYYYDVEQLLGDSSILFAAYEGDEPVAFLWMAISSATAFELYGGMSTRGQELRANYMLKWHAISKCKAWGISRYDMNGLLNDGVSTFKRGFADHENTLVGTYDYPLGPLYGAWTKGLPALKKLIRLIKR
ncbi:MAG: peptidoglycan bridge formation glycyltransferase FemA/FemB family protein [Candidatus Saccharimonas sp.]